MTDQYTFQNPVTQYDKIEPPFQHQDEPGLDMAATPTPVLGEDTYRGSRRLEGRRAIITGADSGIGAAVAIAYAREGADVVLSHLPEEQSDADRIIAFAEASGRNVVDVPGDIRDPQHAAELVKAAVDKLGGVDIIVNNAGKQVSVEDIEDLGERQIRETFETNVYPMYRLIKEALPHLPPGSTIINTTSIQAYSPLPHLLDYAATKAAINNFTKGLAMQLAPKGIRVNAVAPGPVWPSLQVSDGQPLEALPKFGHDTALGRAGQPAEMAPCFVFLASQESSYVVGETLNANGGMHSP